MIFEIQPSFLSKRRFFTAFMDYILSINNSLRHAAMKEKNIS